MRPSCVCFAPANFGTSAPGGGDQLLADRRHALPTGLSRERHETITARRGAPERPNALLAGSRDSGVQALAMSVRKGPTEMVFTRSLGP